MPSRAVKALPLMNEFELNEAVALIYRLVVLQKDIPKRGKKPDITQIGHICGVLTLNDQIEVVIKFYDGLRQFTKEEFVKQIALLDT